MYLDIKIPRLQIAHLGGNLEVGNIKIHLQNQDNLFRKCKMTTKNRLYLNRRSVFHYTVSSEHPFFVQVCGGVLEHKIS